MDDSQIGFSVAGFIIGGGAWFVVRYVLGGFFTVDQNQKGVVTSFGRAQRLHGTTLDHPMAQHLRPGPRERYSYPQVLVLRPGCYLTWPRHNYETVGFAVGLV